MIKKENNIKRERERERENYEKIDKKIKKNVLERMKVLIRKRIIYKKKTVKIALAGIRTHIVLCKKPNSYPLRYGFFCSSLSNLFLLTLYQIMKNT